MFLEAHRYFKILMLFGLRPPLAFAALALFTVPAVAVAQNAYVLTKVIDDQTTRPDGQGTFYIGSVDAFPSLDGNTVLF